MKKLSITFILTCFTIFFVSAQCEPDEFEVSIVVGTDHYGYEIYWELLPSGTPCGDAPIFIGGNTEVGCSGGGIEAQIPGGYGNDTSTVEGPWCLSSEETYDILFIDDWADGGANFTVYISGYPMYEFSGSTSDETFTFLTTEPPLLDVGILTLAIETYVDMGEIEVKGELKNLGTSSIHSFDIHYSIDGGEVVSQNVTGINIESYEVYSYQHPIIWLPTALGPHTLNVWISNLNGSGVEVVLNDSVISKIITVKNPTPNILSSYTLSSNTFNYNLIGSSSIQVDKPTDLDFHPNGDLWLLNRGLENTGGSTVTFVNPGKENQESEWKKDGNAWHFMSLPSGIAFSNNGNFATSPSVYDANHNGGSPFTGPSLWSGDITIYAEPSGGNGSHLDMLHESPYAMGIASEKENVYWVFDGNSNDIVRYDFVEDHGAGNNYHNDGIVRRYTGMEVTYINTEIPCHMELDENKEWLYIVDGGSQRILRLNITSGNTPTILLDSYESLTEYSQVSGAQWEVVVSSGLIKPSGIDVIDDRMIVSDYDNGDIVIYDISVIPATEITRLNTLEPGVTGVVIGPEGRIWYVNYLTHKVFKIEPNQIAACTSLGAYNYNPEASIDDGSCLYYNVPTSLVDSLQCLISQLNQTLNTWNISIDLTIGWNMFGYGCPEPINIQVALSEYVEIIDMAKNNNGDVYLPEWDFNGIGNLLPGMGYQIKLSESIIGFALCDAFISNPTIVYDCLQNPIQDNDEGFIQSESGDK